MPFDQRGPVGTAPTPIITVQVPILMYHHVGHGNSYTMSVSLPEFTAQMDWLKQNGYTSISIDQIAAALRSEAPLPPRSVALTFDDGWSYVYTNAVPVMQARGFRGTFFVVTNYSGGRSPSYLDWAQIKSLRETGHWIGAHSLSHPNLNLLNAVVLQREVVSSKAELEKNIGGVVTVFAYPYGANSPRVIQMVQEAGYVAAVAVNPRIQQRSDQIYRLNRFNMYSGMTLEQFQALVTGVPIALPNAPRLLPRPNWVPTYRRTARARICD